MVESSAGAVQQGPLARLLQWLGLAGPPALAPSRVAPLRERALRARITDEVVAEVLAIPSQPLPPPSLDPGEIRAFLVRSVFAHRDRLVEPGDIDFLDRVLRELGSETLSVPLFPQGAWALDQLIRGGDPQVVDVARIVRREPDLVRRVWSEANAPGWARGVTSLDHAISRIGFDALWRLCMAACFQAPVLRVPGHEPEVESLRRLCLATARVAGWLSEDRRGDPYLAGLLHPVGGLVVYRLATPPPGHPGPRPLLVRAVARELEACLSVLVADTWGMSLSVLSGVGFHPAPELAPPEGRRAATILRIARLAVLAAQETGPPPEDASLGALAQLDDFIFDPGRTVEVARKALSRVEDPPRAMLV